tara:strand:- start:927 stop:1208 length:282 start_codon:yes stop_codon:yes gene_type:complete
MKLECDSYYFYPNGEFKTSSEWNNRLDCYSHDIYEVSRAIRIFGTRKQIDKAFNDYCDASGLNVDEGYDFEDKDKLKEYAQLYKNKALIINLR